MEVRSQLSGGKRVVTIICLIATDLIRVQSAAVATVTALLLTGVAFQAVGFILMFQILLALSENNSSVLAADWIFLSGLEISIGMSLQTAIFLFFISLLTGSFVLYLGRSKTLKVGIAYEKVCTKRVITAWHEGRFGSSTDVHTGEVEAALQLLTRDVRVCGRAARTLVSAVYPMLLLLFLSLFLLYLNAKWTAVVFIGLLLVGSLMVRYFAAGASAAFSLEATAADSKKVKKQLLLDDLHSPINSADFGSAVEAQFRSGPLARNIEAYEERLNFQIRNTALTELAGIVLLSVLLAYGAALLHLQGEMAIVISFAIGLRFLITNLRQIMGMISALVRFFPSIERYAKMHVY